MKHCLNMIHQNKLINTHLIGKKKITYTELFVAHEHDIPLSNIYNILNLIINVLPTKEKMTQNCN